MFKKIKSIIRRSREILDAINAIDNKVMLLTDTLSLTEGNAIYLKYLGKNIIAHKKDNTTLSGQCISVTFLTDNDKKVALMIQTNESDHVFLPINDTENIYIV